MLLWREIQQLDVHICRHEIKEIEMTWSKKVMGNRWPGLIKVICSPAFILLLHK